MASFAYFEMVDDDGAIVRYRFGPERDAMTRTLLFDKEARRPLPAGEEEREDHVFLGTALTILRRFKQDGQWPPNGVHAS